MYTPDREPEIRPLLNLLAATPEERRGLAELLGATFMYGLRCGRSTRPPAASGGTEQRAGA